MFPRLVSGCPCTIGLHSLLLLHPWWGMMMPLLKTESRPELDEQEQQAINERLAYIADHITEQPEVRVKYFVPDGHKSGGAFVVTSGKVKKTSDTDGTIVMADGCKIRLSDITDLSF